MAPKAKAKAFAGEAWEKGLDITDLHMAWDGDLTIRTRLRNGGLLLHEKSGLACDNHICKLNRSVLEPILMGMASSAERKLPSLNDLRNEMQITYRTNCRVGQDVQSAVAGDAVHIRKLLSHVKAKVRRHEVSLDTCPNHASHLSYHINPKPQNPKPYKP